MCLCVIRKIFGQVIRTTILPNCSPLAIRSNAARPFSRSKTESTCGRSFPPVSSPATAVNSASLPIVEPMIVH